MFDPPRYATRGVMGTLPQDVQFTLWAMVDLLCLQSGVKPDYLQVFELSPFMDRASELNQAIRQSQEQPCYVATNLMRVSAPVAVKVFIIDDGEHATMMLASEY
ncbi:DUF960 family protein [Alicyclobacillus sp. ALC3]|uniref:DUF960 family protein n=1 Tax=Alicyclobacillus sp. ALC3 TaxID=2796143 RepID=UPI0023795CC3|nr:DUF960 family protein [Alicyclobacillus sp. ALC3]WDL99185.1 hypothetical protein JC200_11390 [Alicyclobacillus sp. ALC3]